MPVSDAKKIQTFINLLGQQAIIIRAALDVIDVVETAYLALDPTPDVTGTALQGNKATIATSKGVIRTEISKVAWQDQIDGIVLSHRGEAL